MSVKQDASSEHLCIQLSYSPQRPMPSSSPSSSSLLEYYTSLPIQKYPAKAHARAVATRLKLTAGVLYLESSPSALLEDSDQPAPFRQRRYFQYLTGAPSLPDSFVVYHVSLDRLALYIPPPDPQQVLWSGPQPDIEDCLELYDVDDVVYSTELPKHLKVAVEQGETFYALHPGHTRYIPSNAKVDTNLLVPAIGRERMIKDAYELQLLLTTARISLSAHYRVQRATLSGAESEAELEGVFLAECLRLDAHEQAYEPIVAAGTNAATLHYVRNNEPLAGRQLLLIDAAAELDGYAADITRTFPISGQWTVEAKQIWDLVKKMQTAAIEITLPGRTWKESQDLAMRVAITGLLELGILHNGSVDEIFNLGTGRAFFPHGLGHFIGLEVHDVGYRGELEEERIMATVTFRPNMVLTVEPGVYFNKFVIGEYLKEERHRKYVDESVLERYWSVGGVRIEDDVLVTENGNWVFTEEVEKEVLREMGIYGV